MNLSLYLTGGSSARVLPKNENRVQEDTTIYIPETVIQFTVSMLKPNTKLYAFFDGKDVTSYIQPTGSNFGDTLITDNVGYASGNFKIPNNSSIKFIAGQREFKLTDSPNNTESTTSASATYTYTGTSDNPSNPTLDSSSVNQQGNVQPLIQSFYCGERGGMFVSKIGLYFYSKDENKPLLLQLREVKEDKVISEYIPGSSVTVLPSTISTSTDPLNATPTWVEFANPIYLSEGKEYAIFIRTNSNKYIVHMVDYGKQTNDVTATKDISSRSIIKYAGIDNWVRDNSRGIKYTIQKCKFDTTNSYVLNLGNVNLGARLLSDNSLSVTKNGNMITVTDPNHSFNVGSFVTISGLPEGTYAENIPSYQINGIHRINSVTWNTFSFNNYYAGDVETPINNANVDLIFGTNVSTDYDYQYDKLVLNINSLSLTGTDLKYQIKGLSGESLDGNEQSYVADSSSVNIVPKTIFTPNNVKKVTSQLNSERFSIANGKSLQLVATLKTNNENVTPMIDKHNMNAIIVENLINNQNTGEENDNTGTACARQIWKTVNLYEQATGIKVTFFGSVQANTNVKVYYKTLGVDENVSIDSKEWVEMPLERDVSKSLNESDFQQYNYLVDKLSPFKSFKTKLVMSSTDSTKVPLIKKYAAIAFVPENRG